MDTKEGWCAGMPTQIIDLPPQVLNEQDYKGGAASSFIMTNIYGNLAQGNVEAIIEACDEYTEWTVNGPTYLAKCDFFRGKAGVRSFFEKLRSAWQFDDNAPVIHEIYELGEGRVCCLGEEAGIEKQTGGRFYARWTHIWDIDPTINRIHRLREFLTVYRGSEMAPHMRWGTEIKCYQRSKDVYLGYGS